MYQWCNLIWSMPALCGHHTHAAKDIHELEKVQRFAGRMATHNWNSIVTVNYNRALICPPWKEEG
jgi:hypothetical protein